jgi:3-dehydroquinate dehydratase (EC 4.2.1.10)
MKILIVNGPNLNFLGIREKDIYGSSDYSVLLDKIEKKANELGIEAEVFQSNSEGEIIDALQRAYMEEVDGIIINPAAYTHYSYAIRDALASLTVPKIEVHISNIYRREDFRHTSVTAPVCDGQISGLGFDGYLLAMEAVVNICKKKS